VRGKVNRTWAMPSGTTSSTFLVTTLGIEKALGVQSHGWPVSSGSTVTAKEKLRERIETFTEEEAAETLQLLDRRTNPLTILLENAPLDDEPVTDEEEAAVQVAREEIARGETISLEEIRAEFDAQR
jgi:hypothetical protein